MNTVHEQGVTLQCPPSDCPGTSFCVLLSVLCLPCCSLPLLRLLSVFISRCWPLLVVPTALETDGISIRSGVILSGNNRRV